MTTKRITPVLYVDAIEPALPFWVDRLGFELTTEVPEEDRLGFVILQRDGLEVMYQTRESVAGDVPELADRPTGGTLLFIEVDDLEGTVDVNTSGGSISMGDIVGPVRAHTSGGSISLDGAQGDAQICYGGTDTTDSDWMPAIRRPASSSRARARCPSLGSAAARRGQPMVLRAQ